MLLVSFDFLVLPTLANKVIVIIHLHELYGLILGVEKTLIFTAHN